MKRGRTSCTLCTFCTLCTLCTCLFAKTFFVIIVIWEIQLSFILSFIKQNFADIEQKSKFKCARKLHLRKKLGCWQLCYYHVSVLPLIRYFDRSAAQPPWGDDTTYYNVIRHNAAKTKHKYKYKYKMSNHHGAMTPPIIMSGLCL